MAVETLAAFRAADKGMDVKPVIIAVKGTDGEIYIAKVNPATGALVVEATIDVATLATETTLAAVLADTTSIDATLTNAEQRITGIQENVEDIEVLVTATNTKLDTIDGHIDGLETAVGSTNTKLDTIAGYVDGLETAVGSTNTKLDSLIAFGGATFFTKPYDQIVPTSDATHDIYTTKLATVTQQVLTITYADATKEVATDYSVTNH